MPVVTFGLMPFNEDDFDRDITADMETESMRLGFAFAEMHEAFVTMVEVGFTESQALRFLAFVAIHEGDI